MDEQNIPITQNQSQSQDVEQPQSKLTSTLGILITLLVATIAGASVFMVATSYKEPTVTDWGVVVKQMQERRIGEEEEFVEIIDIMDFSTTTFFPKEKITVQWQHDESIEYGEGVVSICLFAYDNKGSRLVHKGDESGECVMSNGLKLGQAPLSFNKYVWSIPEKVHNLFDGVVHSYSIELEVWNKLSQEGRSEWVGKLPNANSGEFYIIEKGKVYDYEIREDGVYYKGKLIKGADVETFEIVGGGYSKDSTNVWYEISNFSYQENIKNGEILYKVNLESLDYLGGALIKDDSRVFYNGELVVEYQDFFEYLGGGIEGESYARDEKNIYYIYGANRTWVQVLTEVDYKTFEHVKYYYAKDKNHVYTGKATFRSCDS
jgi:hypothetical protein